MSDVGAAAGRLLRLSSMTSGLFLGPLCVNSSPVALGEPLRPLRLCVALPLFLKSTGDKENKAGSKSPPAALF
jgi:hypothetical protein